MNMFDVNKEKTSVQTVNSQPYCYPCNICCKSAPPIGQHNKQTK